MAQPSLATIKRLFAVSGGVCAFPGCDLPLVDSESGKVTGRICHINACSPDGPRYDPDQSEEERHSFDNLVLMCPIHHDVIDANPDSYTVARLIQIKAEHEGTHAGGTEPTEEIAFQLQTLDQAASETQKEILAFLATFDHLLSTIDMVQLIKLVPRGLVLIKNLFAKRFAESFLEQANLTAISLQELGELSSPSLKQTLVFLLQTAWDKGYFMAKFYRHNRILPPQKTVDGSAVLDYIIEEYEGIENLSIFLDVFLQRAISMSTEKRVLLETLNMFPFGSHLTEIIAPNIELWGDSVRSSFGYGALTSEIEDELVGNVTHSSHHLTSR